jgi:hypothetical protein
MTPFGKRVVIVEDPHNQPEDGAGMEFRLTYAGPLHATQRDSRPGQPSRHMQNKHDIPLTLHRQLRELWNVMPGLNGAGERRPQELVFSVDPNYTPPLTTRDALAAQHVHYGFNFVPLVTQQLDLIRGLDILLLRPDRPGSIVWAGDIDNRLKTLLDAMRIPEAHENYSSRTPSTD